VAEASDEVVVDQAGGLHEGVDDGGADEAKATLSQVFAEGGGQRSDGGNLAVGVPFVLHGRAADKLPGVGVEAAELLLDFEEGFCVGNRGVDLEAIADDARVAQQLFRFFRIEARDFFGIEAGKEFAIAFALFQDGVPAEAGLRTLEREEFEPDEFVVNRDAPFFIVVTDVQGIRGPVAANIFLCSLFHYASTSQDLGETYLNS